MLDKILGTEFESFTNWQGRTGNDLTDVRGTEEWAGMSDIIRQFQEGTIPQEVIDAMIGFTGQTLGYGSGEELTGDIARRREELSSGISGQQGLTPELEENLRLQSRESLRQAETFAQRALEGIRASGQSTARYFMMADEHISNITNLRLQSELMIANEDWERKNAEFQVKDAQLNALVASGQISNQQYLEAYQNNRAMALQGYAKQVDNILQQNQEVFQMYSADQQAVAATLQNMYAGLQASMGLDQFALAEAETMYMNQIMPFLIQLDILTQEEMAEMQQRALDIQQQANVMGFIGGIISSIALIFG
jgi:hypothetical protein